MEISKLHIDDFCEGLHNLIEMYNDEAQEELEDGIYRWDITLKVDTKKEDISVLVADIKQIIKVVK